MSFLFLNTLLKAICSLLLTFFFSSSSPTTESVTLPPVTFPPCAFHFSLPSKSRPAPHWATSDPSWPLYLLSISCPAAQLGWHAHTHTHSHTHPHRKQTCRVVICSGQGQGWPLSLGGSAESWWWETRPLAVHGCILCSFSMLLFLFAAWISLAMCLSVSVSLLFWNGVKFSVKVKPVILPAPECLFYRC